MNNSLDSFEATEDDYFEKVTKKEDKDSGLAGQIYVVLFMVIVVIVIIICGYLSCCRNVRPPAPQLI